MTTPAIEQLYATHCTLATASQHRTTGPRGEEVFEYSARSASVPGNRAHELFQCVEMSVKFALPSDAPSSKKLEYTAENCPWRRLSYFPNLSGKRSASHSVYRQKDTRGRPGSYFAHALLTPNREESDAFGPLDVLQLWKSPEWVLQDDASLPHDLPPPKPLAEWTGFRQYINESVLIAFLTQPAGGDFSCCVDDAFDSAIPARWRDIPVEQRQRLLVDLLACALYTRGARRDPVWVVVEPGLAALLFFGVFRLLPKTKLIDALSFSTFQSHNDPTAPALAACSFFDPATGDLPPEAYRGAIINTYNARRGQLLKSIPTETAQILVDRWIAGDEARGALSELRKAARQWSIDTAADLESFLKVDPLVERLVSTEPIVPIATEEIPRTPGPRGYLIARLVERLKKSNTATRVAANLGQDSQRLFRIMELLLDENADAAAHELGQTFCKKLPADLLPPLLANAEISESIRVAALVDFTKKEGTVPSQVDLWVARLPAGYPKTLPRLVLEQVNPTVQCQILRLALDDPKALAPSEIDLARLRLAATVGRDAKVNPRELHEALWRPIPDRATQLNCVRDPEIHAALVAQLPSDDETLRGLAESILNKLHSDTVWPTGEWNALRRIAAFVPADRRWEFDSWEKLDRLSKELGDDLNVPASVLPWKAKQAREAAVEGAVKRLIAWVHETYGELGFLRNGEGDSIEDYDGTAHADFVLRPIPLRDFDPAVAADVRRRLAQQLSSNTGSVIPRAGKKGKSTSAARLQLRYIYAAIAAVVLLSIGWWGFFGRPKARTTETETHVADGEPRREDTKGTLPTNPKKKEPRSGKNADDSEKPRDAAQANDGSDREPGLHNTKPDPPRTVDPIPPKVATTPNGTAQQMPDATAETAGNPQPDNDRPAIVDKAGSPQPVPSPAAPPSMTTAAEERSTFRGLSKAIRVPIKALSESPQPIPNIGNKDGSGPISCKLHGPLVKTGDKPVQPAKDYYEIRGELIDGKHYDIQRRNRKGDSWTSVASIHLRGQPTIALRTLESEDKFALLSLYSCVVEFEYPKSFPEFAFFVDDKWVWQRFGNMDHNAPTIPIQRSSPFVTAEYPLVIHKARLEVPPNVNPIDAKQTFTTEMTLPIEKRSQTPVLGFSIDSARSILQIEGPELRSQSGNAGSNQPTSAAARAKKDSLDKRITSFAISVYKTTKTDLERKKEIRGGSPKAIRKAYGDVADDFRSTASKINDLKDPDVETEFSNAKVIVGKQNAIYDDAVELAKTLYPSATGNSVPKLNMPITAPSKREYIKKFGEEFPKWQNEFLSFWEKAAVDIAEMDSARPVPWKAIVTGTVCRVYSPVWEGDGEARNLVGGVYTEIAELVPKSK